MRGVAHVIFNRAKELGIEPCVVVSRPAQFKLMGGPINEEDRWKLAQKIAKNPGPDITRGATYFHNTSIKPYWSYKLKVTYKVAGHIFYKKK